MHCYAKRRQIAENFFYDVLTVIYGLSTGLDNALSFYFQHIVMSII